MGFPSTRPPTAAPSAGRGEQPKPTASFTPLPLSPTDLGIYFVLNLKNLARCCYFTNPLLKSSLRKRASSFLENPTITSRNSSQKGPGRKPATLAGSLTGRRSAETKDTRTLAHAFCSCQISGLMFGFEWNFNKEVE